VGVRKKICHRSPQPAYLHSADGTFAVPLIQNINSHIYSDMSPIAITALGARILTFTTPLVAASSGDLTGKFSGIINILNLVGLVLAFGGLLFAAVMFMMGQTERVLYGLVGAGIGGLAFIIIKVMFSTAGGSSDVDSLNMGTN
jgi:hypothetical protein